MLLRNAADAHLERWCILVGDVTERVLARHMCLQPAAGLDDAGADSAD